MMNETMIGVDLAKAVFQVHGASMTGNQGFRVYNLPPATTVAQSDGRLTTVRNLTAEFLAFNKGYGLTGP